MAQTTKAFEDAIRNYLDGFAGKDAKFAEKYHDGNNGKTIEGCCNFIASEVKKMGVCGLADEEVYGLAVHYYDEENSEAEQIAYSVVVNQQVELTEEEKAEARKNAMERFEKEMYERFARQNTPKKKTEKKTDKPMPVQLELF